jgi:hypothetical protein
MNVSNLAFYIGKNTNTNVTIYSYNIVDEANNQIDLFNPLDCYWIMREKENAPREELTTMEKMMYNYDIVESDTDDIIVKIKALPDEIIKIRKIDGKYYSIITIDDPLTKSKKDVYLKKVFAHQSGTFLNVFVESLDIIYQDPITNKLHTLSRNEQKGMDYLTKK